MFDYSSKARCFRRIGTSASKGRAGTAGAGETPDSVFSESGRMGMESGWLSGSRYPGDCSFSGSDEPEG